MSEMNSLPTQKDPRAKKSFLESAFPVPRALSLSLTSIEISDGNLRFLELSTSRGDLSPLSYGAIPFPRIHGQTNEKARAEAILALKSWALGKNRKTLRTVIHEDEAYVFKVTIPTAHPKEIRPAIEALLEENVPIPPNEAIFEYDVIASDEKLGETTVAVSVIAKDAIDEHIKLFKESGLRVVSIETEARAIARAIFPRQENGVRAVLAICPNHSIAFIAEKGKVAFSSSIPVGSRDLDKAISKTLGITEADALVLKKEKILGTKEGDMKLFEAMLPALSTIRDELGKMLVYWKSQEKKERGTKEVEEIILLGSNSLIAGFDRYISSTSRLPVRHASVWTNILDASLCPPGLNYADSLDYGALIGALL